MSKRQVTLFDIVEANPGASHRVTESVPLLQPSIAIEEASPAKPGGQQLDIAGQQPQGQNVVRQSLLELTVKSTSYLLLHKKILQMMTWTQGALLLQEEESESKLRSRENGFETIIGYAMVIEKVTREVGVCHAFYF